MRGGDPDRFKTAKIERIVRQIHGLKVDELLLLNKRLKELGLPPLPPMDAAAVPARPKKSPPGLSAAVAEEITEGRNFPPFR